MIYSIQKTTLQEDNWGEYIEPVNDISVKKDVINIVLFGSTLSGVYVYEALKYLSQSYNINIVALVTDDARSDKAKISKKKRIWRFFNKDIQHKIVDRIINEVLDDNIEIYTGNIKTPYFHQLLDKWKPDLILMSCFGQIVPKTIFNYPRLGMYNFHPSSISKGIGAGPKPFTSALESGTGETHITIFEVIAEIDAGPIIAESFPIRITNKDNITNKNVLLIDERASKAMGIMALHLVKKIIDLNIKVEYQIDLEEEYNPETLEYFNKPLPTKHGKSYPFPDPLFKQTFIDGQ